MKQTLFILLTLLSFSIAKSQNPDITGKWHGIIRTDTLLTTEFTSDGYFYLYVKQTGDTIGGKNFYYTVKDTLLVDMRYKTDFSSNPPRIYLALYRAGTDTPYKLSVARINLRGQSINNIIVYNNDYLYESDETYRKLDEVISNPMLQKDKIVLRKFD